MHMYSQIDFVGKHFQFYLFRSCTKMPLLSTLCITGKLDRKTLPFRYVPNR